LTRVEELRDDFYRELCDMKMDEMALEVGLFKNFDALKQNHSTKSTCW
jgi:hypothetical protein